MQSVLRYSVLAYIPTSYSLYMQSVLRYSILAYIPTNYIQGSDKIVPLGHNVVGL